MDFEVWKSVWIAEVNSLPSSLFNFTLFSQIWRVLTGAPAMATPGFSCAPLPTKQAAVSSASAGRNTCDLVGEHFAWTSPCICWRHTSSDLQGKDQLTIMTAALLFRIKMAPLESVISPGHFIFHLSACEFVWEQRVLGTCSCYSSFPPCLSLRHSTCSGNCVVRLVKLSLLQKPLKKGWCSGEHREPWAVSEFHQRHLLSPYLCQYIFIVLFAFSPRLAQLVFVISGKCHWISQYEGLAQIMGNGVNYRWKGGWRLAPTCSWFPLGLSAW